MKNQNDWQKAFGQPEASFNARFEQTLKALEEEKPMKRFTFRTAALVMALLLITVGTVYAVATIKIGDYFSLWDSRVNIPKDFESHFDQELTLKAGNVIVTLDDAYVDAKHLDAVVSYKTADGQKAIILPEAMYAGEDTIGNLTRNADTEDTRTIAQYAKDNGLVIYQAISRFKQQKAHSGASDAMMTENGDMISYHEVDHIASVDGKANIVWSLWVQDENGNIYEAEKEIVLDVEPYEEWMVEIGKTVEGMPVSLDALTLRETRMGIQADVAFSVNTKAVSLEDLDVIRHQLWFELLDPATGERIPDGTKLSGGISEVNEADGVISFLQESTSLTKDFTGDTIIVRAYDAFTKERFGSVTVKIK